MKSDLLIPITLAGLLISACSEDPLGRVQPRIKVDPERIDLGDNPIGVLARHKVTVTNMGSGVLTVSSIALVEEEGIPRSVDLSLELEAMLPVMIPGSGRLEFEVHHIPRDDVFDAGLLRILSDDPLHPKVEVEIVQNANGSPSVRAVRDLAQADIEFDMTGAVAGTVEAIDFGVVNLGMSKAFELHVVNVGAGNVPLRVESIGLIPGQNAPGLQISSEPNPSAERVLLPIIGAKSRAAVRRSVKVILSWQPPSAGTVLSATLRITTNDSSRRELDIPITGSTVSADPPVLRLVPPTGISFPDTEVGMTASNMFTAHNDGGSDLVLEPLSIDTNPSNVFALAEPAQTITIRPGASHTFGVNFAPVMRQMYHGTVRIGSNDPARAGAVSYSLDAGGTMSCMPGAPDPGEPMNDSCMTATFRGQMNLPMNMTQRTSWNDSMLYAAGDNDWSQVDVSVDGQDPNGCFLVGYDLGASVLLPGSEQAEICIQIGNCATPDRVQCGMSSARMFILSGDDICTQYMNNIPVFVRVRHLGGMPTCMTYTINFDAR